MAISDKEILIDLQCESTLKRRFSECSLTDFWIGVANDYPSLSNKAMKILLPFATTYLSETGFSTLATMKNKYRSRLDVTNESSSYQFYTMVQQALREETTTTKPLKI